MASPSSKLIQTSLLLLGLLGGLCSFANIGNAKTAWPQSKLVLKNGDTLSGAIVEESKDAVVLRSPVLGEIPIQRSNIAKITTEAPATTKPAAENAPADKTATAVATTKETPPAPAATATKAATPKPAPAAKTEVAKTSPTPKTAPAKAPAKKAPAPSKVAKASAPPSKPWRTKVTFGVIYENGLNNIIRYNLGAQSDKTIGRHQLHAEGRLSYASQNSQATTDRVQGEFRWRQSFPNRAFTQTQTTYYRDRIAKIDTNLDQNVGVGYHIFDTPRMDFNAGFGLTGQYRDADGIEEHMGALAEFFQDQTIKISANSKLVQNLNIQYWPTSPLIAATAKDNSNFKVRFNTTLTSKLTDSISLNLRYDYDYDNTIVAPKARGKQRVTSSLGYSF